MPGVRDSDAGREVARLDAEVARWVAAARRPTTWWGRPLLCVWPVCLWFRRLALWPRARVIQNRRTGARILVLQAAGLAATVGLPRRVA